MQCCMNGDKLVDSTTDEVQGVILVALKAHIDHRVGKAEDDQNLGCMRGVGGTLGLGSADRAELVNFRNEALVAYDEKMEEEVEGNV